MEKIKSGGISQKSAISIACDSEQSVIEYRYSEIVKTTDVEYNTLVQEIINETKQHKTKIEQKMLDQ